MSDGKQLRTIEDDELAAMLRDAIAGGATGLPRHADTFLATLCAEFLVARLRRVGWIVRAPVATRLPDDPR